MGRMFFGHSSYQSSAPPLEFGIRIWSALCNKHILTTLSVRKLDIKTVEKEAYAKGMSIMQYVTSVVPPSLIIFCEAHKGEPSAIKKNVKMLNDEQESYEDKIPKRILVVLLEMYK